MIGLIGSAVGALGSLFSGIGAWKQARKAEKQIHERKDALTTEYAQDKNTDYLDTEAARSTLALLRRQNRRAQEAMNNNAVKSGASDEAKVAAAARQNENYANAVSRIAGMGTQYKQRLKENYQNRMDSLDNALYNIQMGKAQATGDMIGGITNAVGGLISAYGMGKNSSSTPNTAARAAKLAEPATVRNTLSQTVGAATPPAVNLNNRVQGLSYDGPVGYERRTPKEL